MKKIERCRTLEESLHEWLQNPENSEAYFNTTIEEYLEDNDFDSFITSLQKIATAKSGVLQLLKDVDIDQKSLNKLLKEDSKPTWEKVLRVLGYSPLLISSEPIPSY